ncbi:MAG: RNA pseudouridine synthase [Balneolaceae bacterium]|nr:MAG: RNA pseudouridine synthase [Balneolaceae bacterium]
MTMTMQADTYPSILPYGHALSRKVRIQQPYSRFMTCRVGKQEAGLEITDFLMRRFPFRSVNEWEVRLGDGCITQGDTILRPGGRLQAEPPLKFANPAQNEPSVPDEVRILEKTDDYLLVYKPAPLPVHPGGRYNKNTLISILREMDMNDAGPLLGLHRLDSVTSGLVLFGRNPAFTRKAQRAFAEGRVKKTYLALVSGRPTEDHITVDAPVQRKHGYVFECHKSGKSSYTDFEVIRRFDRFSLVRCLPRTGRTHQIRLHLREWGFPVIDDPVYGSNASGEPDSAVQNLGIALLHSRLRIPQEGLDFRLSAHPVAPDLAAFDASGADFLLD